jgi:preprotein translocase subunit YajC
MDYEIFIPITLFVSLAVVLIFLAWYRHRTQLGLQETIRTALDKGAELSPEEIESLGQPKPRPYSDLRRALVSLAIGAGFIAFGYILDEEDAVRPLMAIGAFPILIGIAYFVIWRIEERRKR